MAQHTITIPDNDWGLNSDKWWITYNPIDELWETWTPIGLTATEYITKHKTWWEAVQYMLRFDPRYEGSVPSVLELMVASDRAAAIAQLP